MSNKILKITLDDDDPLIDNKEVGQIIIDSDLGSVNWVGYNGTTEHVVVFDPTCTSPAYMDSSVYDVNNDGVVDDSASLGGVNASLYATKAWVLSNTSSGSMSTNTYDTNLSGVVDNAERLGSQLPSYYASTAWCLTTFGNMKTSVYDINNNGVVDNSELLNGELPSYYLDYDNLINKPDFAGLDDTAFTLETSGDVVQYDGAHWVNKSVIDQGNF